jgi:hypothetical protein
MKNKEIKIEKFGNYLGGLWFKIYIDKDITTEIDIFRSTKKLSIQDSLNIKDISTDPEIESIQLFETKELPY